jgi:hypothetical protein
MCWPTSARRSLQHRSGTPSNGTHRSRSSIDGRRIRGLEESAGKGSGRPGP